MSKRRDDLQKYWEMQLGISYEVEYEYYKKLCGYEYDPKIVAQKYDASSKYVSYKKWQKSVKKHIKNLSIPQLEEYSKYLEQECRRNDTKFGMSQSLFIPFVFYVISTLFDFVVIPLINKYTEENIFSPISGFFLIPFFIYFFHKFLSTKDESTRKYFYQDIKEIIDKRIKKLKSIQNTEKALDNIWIFRSEPDRGLNIVYIIYQPSIWPCPVRGICYNIGYGVSARP